MTKDRIRTVNMCFFLTVVLALLRGEVNYFVGKIINYEPFLLMLSQILLILPAVYYLVATKTNIAEAFRIRKISFRQLFLILVFTIVLMPVLSFVNAISMLFTENHVQNTITFITEQYPLWVNLLSMAVIPALLEETVYRGLFYREYGEKHIGKGILLSAFLFGCMHMNFNQFVYACLMGIIFCALIEATDSILSSIFMHFIINASSLLVAEFTMKMEAELVQEIPVVQTREMMLQTIPYLMIPALVGAVLAFLLFKKICRVSGRTINISEWFRMESGGKLMTLPLAAGISICIVIMIGNR